MPACVRPAAPLDTASPLIADPLFYAVAIPAVTLQGLAKGGFAGAGTLSLPLIALVIDPVQAAAILLPILIVQDVVGMWTFRRTVDRFVLGWTLAGAMIGIALGFWFATAVSPRAVLAAIGLISIVFGAYRLWAEHHGLPPSKSPGWVGTLFGIVSGFTSQVAHAGQPPFQLWVLPRQLPRDVLVGTTAVYFGVVNWLKVPAYLALGQLSAENLATSAALVPVAIATTFAGVWLVRRVPAARFYTAIYVLMILMGAKLLWDGVA